MSQGHAACSCCLPPLPCRHALVAAGRVHSVLITDEVSERTSAFEAQGVGRAQLTMCHRLGWQGRGGLQRYRAGQLTQFPVHGSCG